MDFAVEQEHAGSVGCTVVAASLSVGVLAAGNLEAQANTDAGIVAEVVMPYIEALP